MTNYILGKLTIEYLNIQVYKSNMERPKELTISKNELPRVKIFTYLLTPESPEVSDIENSRIQNSAKSNDDAVISALSVEFDYKTVDSNPSKKIQNLVKKEVNKSISRDVEFARIVSGITHWDIQNTNPIGEPRTEPIQIAEYIISPEEDGLIGIINFEIFEDNLI